ncbi:hypothetical protein BN1708_019555, partial [Verticillium longisporum]
RAQEHHRHQVHLRQQRQADPCRPGHRRQDPLERGLRLHGLWWHVRLHRPDPRQRWQRHHRRWRQRRAQGLRQGLGPLRCGQEGGGHRAPEEAQQG